MDAAEMQMHCTLHPQSPTHHNSCVPETSMIGQGNGRGGAKMQMRAASASLKAAEEGIALHAQ